MLIDEKKLYHSDTADEVLTEAVKTLIPENVKIKLSSKKNRQIMLEKFGDDAFLLPDKLKFPVMNPFTGKYDCALIYAARIRAKQYSGIKPGYREIAAKAEELYKNNRCSTKLNVQIHDGEKIMDIDLQQLVEILF
ncbi:MAG: hypothetical protein PHD05_00325 [Sphaerochaetaceae bacterium]|nr:hypothetical protein [Sphaerochaetaceae bacterium]